MNAPSVAVPVSDAILTGPSLTYTTEGPQSACLMRIRAPIPCTHLCPDTEKDSGPIVSETTHVTFANDRLSSPVSLRSER